MVQISDREPLTTTITKLASVRSFTMKEKIASLYQKHPWRSVSSFVKKASMLPRNGKIFPWSTGLSCRSATFKYGTVNLLYVYFICLQSYIGGISDAALHPIDDSGTRWGVVTTWTPFNRQSMIAGPLTGWLIKNLFRKARSGWGPGMHKALQVPVIS